MPNIDLHKKNSSLQGEFVLKKDGKENQKNKKNEEEKIIKDNVVKNKNDHNSFGNIHEVKSTSLKSDEEIYQDINRKVTNRNLHFFTSLCSYPPGITFKDQEDDEKIILLVRQDFVTNVPWIFASILLALMPFVFLPFLNILFPFLDITNITKLLFLSFYYLLIFGFSILKFTIWYYHMALVTDKRIFDVDVKGILFKSVSETKLDLIQDVSYTQIGAIRSLFNYGDIHIQTAGNVDNFEFDRAPEPDKILDVITDLMHKGKKL